MTPPAGTIIAREASLGLWRTWFDAGMDAIDRKDYIAAAEWLGEALEHIQPVGVHERLYAITQANGAYALWRMSKQYEEQAEHECTPPPMRLELQSNAADCQHAAAAKAEAATPRMKFDKNYPPVNLALGRATQVIGEKLFWQQNRKAAADYFKSSLSYYRRFPAEAGPEREVLRRLYEIAYMESDFKAALDYLEQMERSPFPVPPKGRAQSLACRADVLVQLGRYRDADQLYPRWKALNPKCLAGQDCSEACAHALMIFGRTRLLMGYYADACELLSRGQCLVEDIELNDPWIHFEILLSRAELAYMSADYCAVDEYLKQARAVGVEITPHFTGVAHREARWLIVSARRHLALGRFATAWKEFCEAQLLVQSQCPKRLLIWAAAMLGLAHTAGVQSNIITAEKLARETLCRLEADKSAALTAEMAAAVYELAFAYIQDEGPEEAEPLCRRAIELLGVALRPGHPGEIEMRTTLAKSLLSQHHADQAELECKTAMRLLCEFSPRDWFQEARILQVYAWIARTQRCFHAAIRQLTCAHNLWVKMEGLHKVEHAEKATLILDLAGAMVSQGDLPGATTFLADAQFWRLILALVGSNPQIGYVMNRQANLCILHRLFIEAEWLFSIGGAFYKTALGPNHPFTLQLCKNQKIAQAWVRNPGEPQPCPCVAPQDPRCYCRQPFPCPSSYFVLPTPGDAS